VAVERVQERALEEFERVRNGELLAVVYKLSDDETEFQVDRTLSRRSAYSAVPRLFPADHIRWCALNVRFTCGGGQRSKLVWLSWSPDTLQRPSMRESARLKMAAITAAAPFLASPRVGKGTFSLITQANCTDDLALDTIVRRVSRHEREPVDPQSIEAFAIGAL